MEKFDTMIREIFASSTLRECGRRLEEFARAMEDISDPELLMEVSEHFWKSLNERSAVNLDFDSPYNRGWMLCPPTAQVATYLDITMVPRPTPEEDIAYLLESGQELQRDFDGRFHHVPDMEVFQVAMAFLDAEYD